MLRGRGLFKSSHVSNSKRVGLTQFTFQTVKEQVVFKSRRFSFLKCVIFFKVFFAAAITGIVDNSVMTTEMLCVILFLRSGLIRKESLSDTKQNPPVDRTSIRHGSCSIFMRVNKFLHYVL